MNFPPEILDEIRPLCRSINRFDEGGTTYVLLEALALPEGCVPSLVDALLCPSGRDGYPSRLFLAEKVSGRGSPNWTGEARLIERNWHAYSWKVDVPGLTLAQLIANHLRVFR